MDITEKAWVGYIDRLRAIDEAATAKVAKYIESHEIDTQEGLDGLLAFCYAISAKYGEAAAALACEMYDAEALLEGVALDPAEPADTATMSEVRGGVLGALKSSVLPITAAYAVGRLVKLAGQDTTLKNARRDLAYIAWIPHGDTCAYCLMLAGRGWRQVSEDVAEDGHAKHIHGNCDCAYGVRHKPAVNYGGYDPGTYREIYDNAEGATRNQKLNSMRRLFYDQNKGKISEQKKVVYQAHKELESSAAEEMDVP